MGSVYPIKYKFMKKNNCINNFNNNMRRCTKMTNKFLLITDGSATNVAKDGYVFDGSYAYRVVDQNTNEILHQGGNYNENTTTPRMELMAIAHAFTWLNGYLDTKGIKKDIQVTLISDSQLSIDSVGKFIYTQLKSLKDGVIFNSSKKPVLNQDVIITAVKLILNMKRYGRVNLYHIRSHIPKVRLEETYLEFKDKNGCELDFEEYLMLVQHNNDMDELAGEIYKTAKAKLTED